MTAFPEPRFLNAEARKRLQQINIANEFRLPLEKKGNLKGQQNRAVYEYISVLIFMPNSTENSIIDFWNKIKNDGNKQANFLYELACLSQHWLLTKMNQEMLSDAKQSLISLEKHLSSISDILKKSPYCSVELQEVLSAILEEQYGDDIDEDSQPVDWNGLTVSDLIVSIRIRLSNHHLHKMRRPRWYPRKMEDASAESVFAIRAVKQALRKILDKPSNKLIADMASLLSGNVISEEQVSKNLVNAPKSK